MLANMNNLLNPHICVPVKTNKTPVVFTEVYENKLLWAECHSQVFPFSLKEFVLLAVVTLPLRHSNGNCLIWMCWISPPTLSRLFFTVLSWIRRLTEWCLTIATKDPERAEEKGRRRRRGWWRWWRRRWWWSWRCHGRWRLNMTTYLNR